MKLKFTDRILLFIGALLMVTLGVVILLGSLQFNELIIRGESAGFFTATRLGLMLGGLLAIVFGFYCLSLPHRMKLGRDQVITQKTQSGELSISMQAIESIIQKNIAQHSEVKLQHLRVSNTRSGLEVDIKASLANNINIPLAVNAMQSYIRQSLNASLGIDPKEVRVVVTSADMHAKSSPYRIQEEELRLKPDGDTPATTSDQQDQQEPEGR